MAVGHRLSNMPADPNNLQKVDDVVLLVSSGSDLQVTLKQFETLNEAVLMRVCTSWSEAMVPHQKTMYCSLKVGNELLPQVTVSILVSCLQQMD